MAKTIVWFVIFATLASCARIDAPEVGRYRAVLQTQGGDLPFHVDVVRENDAFAVYVSHGDARLRASSVDVEHRTLVASFGTMTLKATASHQSLEGAVVFMNADDGARESPLHAKLGDTFTFYEESLSDNADVQGRWAMTLASNAEGAFHATAELTQDHDRVTGTLVLVDGSRHRIIGQVHDDEVRLSSFASDDAYLYKLKVMPQGKLRGERWPVFGTHRTVDAVREPT